MAYVALLGDELQLPSDWTEAERWAWGRIVAGGIADFNAREGESNPDFEDLNPTEESGWGESRRLRAEAFLRRILTDKAFVEATPFGGVRILGAVFDDAPIILEHSRLERVLWLEKSRILVPIKARNLRVDGEISFEASFVAGEANLDSAEIRKAIFFSLGRYEGGVTLVAADIGSNLEMYGSTFKGPVILNSATVKGSAFLNRGAIFKAEVDLVSTDIGSFLDMTGSTFEGPVILNAARVKGSAFLREKAIFKAEVDLVSAHIGSNLEMHGSTFEGPVILNSATVKGSAFLREKAVFKSEVDLFSAHIGSLDISNAEFFGCLNLTGAQIAGEFRLGSANHPPARWQGGSALLLQNASCGALQDWWESNKKNAWPKKLGLEGFTYRRLGGLRGVSREADMRAREASSYIQWLRRDSTFSPQPYECLAQVFREAGEPEKANAILYEARERRRSQLLDPIGGSDQPPGSGWWQRAQPRLGHRLRWLGLSMLKWTIGYGLGGRYFRVLWWIGSLTLLGGLLLIVVGAQSPETWPRLFLASFDQLLPIITLDKAHNTLIFGNASAKPPVAPQPYCVLAYFYAHKVAGWVLGSFLVAGLAGLTQRK